MFTGIVEELGTLAAFEDLGLGRLRLSDRDGRTYTFEGDDLLEVRPGSTRPTCYLALSYLEGAVRAAEGLATLGAEVKCQSRGDARCLFIVTAR